MILDLALRTKMHKKLANQVVASIWWAWPVQTGKLQSVHIL